MKTPSPPHRPTPEPHSFAQLAAALWPGDVMSELCAHDVRARFPRYRAHQHLRCVPARYRPRFGSYWLSVEVAGNHRLFCLAATLPACAWSGQSKKQAAALSALARAAVLLRRGSATSPTAAPDEAAPALLSAPFYFRSDCLEPESKKTSLCRLPEFVGLLPTKSEPKTSKHSE